MTDERPAAGGPTPRFSSILGIARRGFHRIAYTEWGSRRAHRVVVCVHGLTRQGRDFDRLAAALAERGCRVICPDLVGRGRSGRLRDPEDYALPQYATDLTALLARLDVDRVDWVGSSLGGLIGMVLAGRANTPIRSLVINDVGPFLPWPALYRIGTNLREAPADFRDFAAAEAFYRRTLAPFGALDDGQWEHLTRYSVERREDGRYRMLCDPAVAHAFRPAFFYQANLWSYWDTIECPTLVLRGATSDLLLAKTAMEMTQRGPGAKIVEFPDCGHAPALMDPDQIGVIVEWLSTTPG